MSIEKNISTSINAIGFLIPKASQSVEVFNMELGCPILTRSTLSSLKELSLSIL
jgi:hypothetical protein